MSASATKPRPRRTTARSMMSAKQMAQTVKDGRAVILKETLTDPQGYRGYLAGMDDFYWLVMDPTTAEAVLVRKGAVAAVLFEPECEYEDESHHDQMETIVAPFRNYVLATFFGRVTTGNED